MLLWSFIYMFGMVTLVLIVMTLWSYAFPDSLFGNVFGVIK